MPSPGRGQRRDDPGLAALAAHRGAWSRLVRAVAPLTARPMRLLILVAAVAAIVTLCDPTAGPQSPASQIVGIALGSLVAAVVVVGVVGHRQSALAARLSARPLRGAGRISYGLYLLHGPVFYVADSLMAIVWPARPLAVQAVVATLASVALAALSWRYWERPWLALRRHLARPTHRSGLEVATVEGAVASR